MIPFILTQLGTIIASTSLIIFIFGVEVAFKAAVSVLAVSLIYNSALLLHRAYQESEALLASADQLLDEDEEIDAAAAKITEHLTQRIGVICVSIFALLFIFGLTATAIGAVTLTALALIAHASAQIYTTLGALIDPEAPSAEEIYANDPFAEHDNEQAYH